MRVKSPLIEFLVEQLLSKHVTVVVRGAPVINDATLIDAQAVGLDKIVEVINNGSDAPGTIINDCDAEFRRRFAEADLIIAKGQGNFETLSNENRQYLLFIQGQMPCDCRSHQTAGGDASINTICLMRKGLVKNEVGANR